MLLIGPIACLALMLRTSGKRTLTKPNMFHFVVTVALGSTLASVILTKSVGLMQGVTAFAVLVGLQYAITWLAVRWPAFERAIRAEPTLLLRAGVFLDRALKAQRVTRAEVEAALRAPGKGEASGIAAVVLETDGSLTVITEGRAGAGTLDFHRKGDAS